MIKLPMMAACVLAAMVGAMALADPPAKALPLPGELFMVDGRPTFVILPPEADRTEPLRWVWYAPTLPGLPDQAERWMFERFLNAGIAIAGIDAGESFGNPAGRATYQALYDHLTTQRGFDRKPVLLARSRGGLMLYNWAAEHAESVGGIAGIYPVCNLVSYPGLAKAAPAYEMTAQELEAKLAEHNPIDRLKPLADAGVPIFHIHGDIDTLVPLETNSGELARRYRELGGTIELEIAKGQGHNMWPGFFQSEKLVKFVIEAKPGDKAARE